MSYILVDTNKFNTEYDIINAKLHYIAELVETFLVISSHLCWEPVGTQLVLFIYPRNEN